MKATSNRSLVPLDKCTIFIPTYGEINPYILPEISDQKSAAYNDEPIIGRAMPLKTYSHSENRAISITLHFMASKKSDVEKNIIELRALQSAVYPRDSAENGITDAPFIPPPVCRIKCGRILADEALCCVLKNYSVKFPTDVPWDKDSYIPWKFDVDTSWDVVYKSSDLPGAERIFRSGR